MGLKSKEGNSEVSISEIVLSDIARMEMMIGDIVKMENGELLLCYKIDKLMGDITFLRIDASRAICLPTNLGTMMDRMKIKSILRIDSDYGNIKYW